MIKVEWIDSGRDNLIPGRFWKSLQPDEVYKIFFEQNGILNAEQCALLWRIEDRNTPPPERLEIFVNVADVKRFLRKHLKNKSAPVESATVKGFRRRASKTE